MSVKSWSKVSAVTHSCNCMYTFEAILDRKLIVIIPFRSVSTYVPVSNELNGLKRKYFSSWLSVLTNPDGQVMRRSMRKREGNEGNRGK